MRSCGGTFDVAELWSWGAACREEEGGVRPYKVGSRPRESSVCLSNQWETQFEGVQGNCMIFLKAVNVGSFASTCVNLYEFLVHVSNSVYAEPTDKVLKWKHEGRVEGRRGGKKLALTLLPPGGTLQQHLRAAAAVWLQQRGLLCCIACWRGGRARGLSAYCTTSSSWRLRLWSLHVFKFQRGRGRGKKWMN